MLAEYRDTGLEDWLAQAEHSRLKELKSFAQGIRRDYAAVRAAFTSEWSNGPVESQVNCSVAPILTFYGCTSCAAPKCSLLCIPDPPRWFLFLPLLALFSIVSKQPHFF